jgi:NhaA family Na+:H+ antiporter
MGALPWRSPRSRLIAANSPLGPDYRALLAMTGEIRIGSISLAKSLEHWINDGLMAIFFLLIGVEIKREALAGALAGIQQAALPAIAALGGFVVPALIYEAVTWGDVQAMRGWAIASATDIAFAVAVCAALGRLVVPSLRTFLLAWRSSTISWRSSLHRRAFCAVPGAGRNRDRRANVAQCVQRAATIALRDRRIVHLGVRAQIWRARDARRRCGRFCAAVRRRRRKPASKPWVIYTIVPIFAFTNAGVPLGNVSWASLTTPIPLAIIAGLFLGKQLGVFGACAAAMKLGIACAGASQHRPALWSCDPHGHWVHHEPVHRHSRLRGRSCARSDPPRRAGRLTVIRRGGRARANRSRANQACNRPCIISTSDMAMAEGYQAPNST